LLGELYHNREWLVNRTFISRDLARPNQYKGESELIASLKKDILKAMLFQGFNEDDLRIRFNVVNALTVLQKD